MVLQPTLCVATYLVGFVEHKMNFAWSINKFLNKIINYLDQEEEYPLILERELGSITRRFTEDLLNGTCKREKVW
jgi:hypothetical protein